MYGYIVAAFLVASVKGGLVLEGQCDFATPAAVRNLNVTQFLGEWQQIARIDNEYEAGDCSTSMFSGIYENGTLRNGTVVNRSVVNHTVHWDNGTFTAGTNGAYVVRYQDLAFDLLVLATDYTGYALLYSCQVQNSTHKKVWSSQLGRAKQFTTEQTSLINVAIVLNSDLRNATWRAVGHTEEHCHVSSGISLIASPILLSLVLCNIMSKLL